MKIKTILSAFIVASVAACVSALAADAPSGIDTRARKENGRLIYSYQGQTVMIDAWGKDGLRVRVVPRGGGQTSDWALDIPSATKGQIEITPTEATIRNGKISAQIHDIYTQ